LKKKPENTPEDRPKALKYAQLLLKYRARSEKEISQRLKEKGFDTQVIQEIVKGLKAKHLLEKERSALEIVKEKLAELQGIDRQKAKRRVYNYLLRRGFSEEEISEVKENLCLCHCERSEAI